MGIPLVAGVCRPAARGGRAIRPGRALGARPGVTRGGCWPRSPRTRGWRCRPGGAERQAGGPAMSRSESGARTGGSDRLALDGVESALELGDGLAVDLTDAALGDPEDLADLGQGESVVVVEAHDLALA